jgi:hypothetical protein
MTETTIHYDGLIKVEFDPGEHVYEVSQRLSVETPDEWSEPRKVNGVTTPIGDHTPKPWLSAWAVKVGAEAASEMYAKMGEGTDIGKDDWDAIIKAFKGAHRTRLRSAGDVGTLVHAWCESYAKATIPGSGVSRGEPVPDHPEAKLACAAFVEWMDRNHVIFEHVERRVYHIDYDYAGTVDGIAWVNDERCVIDLKTSGHINQGMHMQTAAYAAAYMREFPFGERFNKRLILRLPKTGEPFEIAESSDPDDFVAFRNALDLNRYWNQKQAAEKAMKKEKK